MVACRWLLARQNSDPLEERIDSTYAKQVSEQWGYIDLGNEGGLFFTSQAHVCHLLLATARTFHPLAWKERVPLKAPATTAPPLSRERGD